MLYSDTTNQTERLISINYTIPPFKGLRFSCTNIEMYFCIHFKMVLITLCNRGICSKTHSRKTRKKVPFKVISELLFIMKIKSDRNYLHYDVMLFDLLDWHSVVIRD